MWQWIPEVFPSESYCFEESILLSLFTHSVEGIGTDVAIIVGMLDCEEYMYALLTHEITYWLDCAHFNSKKTFFSWKFELLSLILFSSFFYLLIFGSLEKSQFNYIQARNLLVYIYIHQPFDIRECILWNLRAVYYIASGHWRETFVLESFPNSSTFANSDPFMALLRGPLPHFFKS